VINASPSISGRYPNLGPKLLLKAGIPVLDQVGKDCFDTLPDNEEIEVKDERIFYNQNILGKGELLTLDSIEILTEQAKENLNVELDKFIQNTLEYAVLEKDLVLGNLSIPAIKTKMKNKQVVVVVRGQNYREDLKIIFSYIKEVKPILLGVDGGADALLEFGLRPDIIVGDMDSVSDKALCSGAELVVHAYQDGKAPGLKRINDLNLKAITFPAPGTSEDIALILAYENSCFLSSTEKLMNCDAEYFTYTSYKELYTNGFDVGVKFYLFNFRFEVPFNCSDSNESEIIGEYISIPKNIIIAFNENIKRIYRISGFRNCDFLELIFQTNSYQLKTSKRKFLNKVYIESVNMESLYDSTLGMYVKKNNFKKLRNAYYNKGRYYMDNERYDFYKYILLDNVK
jgi:hypothetical protein